MNVFLTPNGAGSRNGSNWSNALGGVGSIPWSSLKPGDNVFIAGGAYNGTITVNASGSSSGRISLKRATRDEPACVAAAGWNNSFDSKIVQTGGIGFGTGRNFVTIDGASWHGWEIKHGANNSGVWIDGQCTDVTLRGLEVHGPANPGSITRSNDCRNLDLTPSGGTVDRLLIQHVDCYDADSTAYISTSGATKDVIVEHSWFHNADSKNNSQFHQNLMYLGGQNNMTIRYCRFFDILVEGVFVGYNGGNLYIYGNLFYKGGVPVSTPRGIETDGALGSGNKIFVYNNTFVDLTLAAIRTTNSGPVIDRKNNIYWNSGVSVHGGSSNYNYSSGSNSDANGIANGADPFVNRSGYDFHLKSGSSAIGKGTTLAAPYNKDMEGRTRKGSMGAFETGSVVTPPVEPPPVDPPPPTNTAPTISSIANLSALAGTAVGPVAFQIGDAQTPNALTVSGSSSNQAILPNSGITFAGSGANRTVTLRPTAGRTGTVTVTITVSDGTASANRTFTVTVSASPVEPPPVDPPVEPPVEPPPGTDPTAILAAVNAVVSNLEQGHAAIRATVDGQAVEVAKLKAIIAQYSA